MLLQVFKFGPVCAKRRTLLCKVCLKDIQIEQMSSEPQFEVYGDVEWTSQSKIRPLLQTSEKRLYM